MKGLFQCPPRASPWVITDAILSPCKGKSFVNCLVLLKFLPLQGDRFAPVITQGVALGGH